MKHIPPDALTRVEDARPSFREELIKRLPTLRRHARTLGDAEFADDLVQATLTRALEYEDAYTAQGAMTAWLRQIVKNIARDQHKSSQRYKLFSDLDANTTDDNSDAETEDFASTVPDETTFGERERQLDAKGLIELAAKIIVPEMWRCLELTGAGFTSEEIAAELGISAAAVRKNIERGRKALQALRASSDDTEHNVSKSIRKPSR
ncbi:RNA polymerase sigma factor, sigma-70 family [Bradyrhizobium sp. Ghvi]|uniref:RNA polymerase sigma factor n=1 Tax=Bradyrhizobium sp. Ghvi TaxID=1855319 RepID=UPI0008E012FF|nr:RNA polymerase sigma factor [Bradyrhizobium sp. Ghvi]SFO18067.1 RNA polymerase sigma factor, sigma-70 family [Bradyrhizobium sp. Ghvi]